MTAHATTNATASPIVGAITISMPATSCAFIGRRSIDAQATTARTSSAAYVCSVARS